MLSLFGKIHLFISVNCIWMDHKSEILMLKEIETVPTLKNHPLSKRPKPTLWCSLANDRIMSLGLMTYSLFMNTANLVKDELTGLTKIHQHSTQTNPGVHELREETCRKALAKQLWKRTSGS